VRRSEHGGVEVEGHCCSGSLQECQGHARARTLCRNEGREWRGGIGSQCIKSDVVQLRVNNSDVAIRGGG
jgi:hypothetical protein